MAAIKRETNKGWKEDSFWSWLYKRLTLTSRREKR
ncbi:MAG: hypothetical protein JWM80_1954 [Cyanobacteria bacterium RYN_339]|nr:hypothetical protein [Cyanobacteria bacterium RYN_339]